MNNILKGAHKIFKINPTTKYLLFNVSRVKNLNNIHDKPKLSKMIIQM